MSSEFENRLDSSLNQIERERLYEDYSVIQTLEMDIPINSTWTQFFGGNQVENMVSYVNRRVLYYVSRQVEINFQQIAFPYNEDNYGKEDPLCGIFQLQPDLSSSKEGLSRVAENLGSSLWRYKQLENFYLLSFKLGEHIVNVGSPHLGLIRLGEFYSSLEANRLNPLLRFSEWVHEARHSDCEEPFSELDLQKMRQGEEPDVTSCGHQHVECSFGHQFFGKTICDQSFWKANHVQAIYLHGIANYCKNCSEEVKQEALLASLYYLSLVRTERTDFLGSVNEKNDLHNLLLLDHFDKSRVPSIDPIDDFLYLFSNWQSIGKMRNQDKLITYSLDLFSACCEIDLMEMCH